MFPDLAVLIPFLLIVVVAVYFQTVTGFGLAMIVMGLASGMGIATVAELASVISIVALINSAVALRGNLHHVEWRSAGSLTLGVLPASILGVILLEYLSAEASDIVQILLGVLIVYGGISMAWRPDPLKTLSSPLNFAYYGVLGGIVGGMFAIPGPPLIFQLYRQPMTIAQIRSVLIFLNAVIAIARTAFVGWQGELTSKIWVLSALCLPVVGLATVAGRRYLPPLSPHGMRRIAFVVLVLMGIGLMLPVILGYVLS